MEKTKRIKKSAQSEEVFLLEISPGISVTIEYMIDFLRQECQKARLLVQENERTELLEAISEKVITDEFRSQFELIKGYSLELRKFIDDLDKTVHGEVCQSAEKYFLPERFCYSTRRYSKSPGFIEEGTAEEFILDNYSHISNPDLKDITEKYEDKLEEVEEEYCKVMNALRKMNVEEAYDWVTKLGFVLPGIQAEDPMKIDVSKLFIKKQED